jgi:hypothetical protein
MAFGLAIIILAISFCFLLWELFCTYIEDELYEQPMEWKLDGL